MAEISFAALDAELAHCADGVASGAGGTAPLEHGRRVISAMLRHPEWDAQPDGRKAMFLKQGGGLLLHLFKATGSDKALDEAITILTAGTNLLGDGDPERPAHLANLGLATRLSGERSGDITVIRRAVAIYRSSVTLSRHDDLDLPKRLSNLGSALKTEYEMSGALEAMDASIDASANAYQRSPSPDIASNLAMGLRDRHMATGRRSDLEQAMALSRAAVAATASAHPGLAVRLNNLSIIHAQRFELDRQDADAKAALEALTRLVDLTPRHLRSAATVFSIWPTCTGGCLA